MKYQRLVVTNKSLLKSSEMIIYVRTTRNSMRQYYCNLMAQYEQEHLSNGMGQGWFMREDIDYTQR